LTPRIRTLLLPVAVAGMLAVSVPAGAHQTKPFLAAPKDTRVIDRDTVRTTLEVVNTSKRYRRARCTVTASSATQGTSVTKVVTLRVPPQRKGGGFHWAEERITLNFDRGPIAPVSITVPHCHRA